MDQAEHNVLACMALDETPRARLHGTNPPERADKAIGRRTNAVGKFPDREAVHRLAGALMLEQYDEWADRRRSMPAERPSGLCDAHEQAAMIAAGRESATSCEEAGGHPLLHHLSGHYRRAAKPSETYAPPAAMSRGAC
ncbi:hypothetical protein LNKW23_37850 [Paralimibaculum aggregatum]|uniref:Transposase n=1 Tax=Paralimibaculum aggregatum TaxID=3036245 RepID=A0ABQ6LRZ2_9RHOB|nr:hypothetical protein LNKW23_37850 [Limibaculum sp. NKW23]